jgi:hypothetical protein
MASTRLDTSAHAVASSKNVQKFTPLQLYRRACGMFWRSVNTASQRRRRKKTPRIPAVLRYHAIRCANQGAFLGPCRVRTIGKLFHIGSIPQDHLPYVFGLVRS